jgi:hypothetical protein
MPEAVAQAPLQIADQLPVGEPFIDPFSLHQGRTYNCMLVLLNRSGPQMHPRSGVLDPHIRWFFRIVRAADAHKEWRKSADTYALFLCIVSFSHKSSQHLIHILKMHGGASGISHHPSIAPNKAHLNSQPCQSYHLSLVLAINSSKRKA